MEKLSVAVLFGGCSEEHDVSVKSAREIGASLNRDKYNVHFVGISKNGEWIICSSPSPGWESSGKKGIISPDKSHHGLLVQDGSLINITHIDVVIPAIHGKNGEDGSIQGLLEMSGIPYVGCGVQSSVVCMDKSLAHIIAGRAGVKTPGFSVLEAGGDIDAESIEYPVFVKPARSGSSFGVKKVETAAALAEAIEEAAIYDSKILIEEAISGFEVGCAVLGKEGDLFTGEVDQIILSHGFFRIHQESAPEKGSENAEIVVPAKISEEQRAEVKKTAERIYNALGCEGLARVDMFLRENGDIILNEVNTFPGFTSYSRYPGMMKAAGVSTGQIMEKLIRLALSKQ